MNSTFTLVDWLVVLLYLGGTLWIGWRASHSNHNFKAYVTGDGTMSWMAVGISLIATSVSATTFLGAPAEVFGADMTFLMLQFGALISIFVVNSQFIPRLRATGATSAYEIIELRFSKTVRRIAALLYSLHLLLRTGILLFGPSLVLSAIVGISVEMAILITAVVALFYTWHGGFKAVVWTEVMQFFVFFGGGIIILILISQQVGGWSELFSTASATGKTRWFNPSLDPKDARTLLSAVFAYAVLEIAIRGCDQQFVQRYLSCNSVKEAKKSSVLSMLLGVVVSLLFYWVGAAQYVYYKVAKVSYLPEELSVNQVFPWFITHDLPIGIRGAIVAAIYAAAMSSLSSAVNALANTTENDLLCSATDDPQRMRRAKQWSLFWGGLGIIAALIASSQQGSLLRIAYFFTGLFTGPLLGLFLFAFWGKKVRPKSIIIGIAGGIATLLLFTPPPFSWAWEPLYPFAWTWNPLLSLLGMTITVLVADRIMDKVSRR